MSSPFTTRFMVIASTLIFIFSGNHEDGVNKRNNTIIQNIYKNIIQEEFCTDCYYSNSPPKTGGGVYAIDLSNRNSGRKIWRKTKKPPKKDSVWRSKKTEEEKEAKHKVGLASSPDKSRFYPQHSDDVNLKKKIPLNVGLILPHSIYKERDYNNEISRTLANLKIENLSHNFSKVFHFNQSHVHKMLMKVNPPPTEIIEDICDVFLPNNVSAIIYLTYSELFGRSTASSQYFLQLAGYLGIPVIAWNADNSGLNRKSRTRLQLQLAPSMEHQVGAMFSILIRYNWHKFSVVTSAIAGHDDFVQYIREKIVDLRNSDDIKFVIQSEVKLTPESPEKIEDLIVSETRIILLYSTHDEAKFILQVAREKGLAGSDYMWIVTQSVLGDNQDANLDMPPGMLGVSFNTSLNALIGQIPVAMQVFVRGVKSYITSADMEIENLIPRLSCDADSDSENAELLSDWKLGSKFYRHLRNVTIKGDYGVEKIRFSNDGHLTSVTLKIVNLRPGIGNTLKWEEIGEWNSRKEIDRALNIKDIVWPGNSHVPPKGSPDKFHLTVGFLDELPFIKITPPDPVSGRCNIDQGVVCKIPSIPSDFLSTLVVEKSDEITNNSQNDDVEKSDESSNSINNEGNSSSKNTTTTSSQYIQQCCSGFCIDLLEKLAKDLGFQYDLIRVNDTRWGILRNGKWSGLMKALVNKEFDAVFTSLKINSDRESAVHFTEPFMESGTTIVVAKRTGIISPTAFLEPFDVICWILIAFVAVQLAAFSIFIFEWLSPSGFDMKSKPPTNNSFSVARIYWLVWALLFQAPVNMDTPRSFTSRFMVGVWALFTVVFYAIYTASLASFMITREEWDEFSGLRDTRLSNPMSVKPPLKFGTVPHTYTEDAIMQHFPSMYTHMQQYNVERPQEGIEKVQKGELDAFIYDGTVLDYMVGQDQECQILTVGEWHAMTGYGAAFPRNSKHFNVFNSKIIEYSENGILERSRRFWFSGSCNPRKEEKRASEPLSPEQFDSALLLLGCGIVVSTIVMVLENLYASWIIRKLGKKRSSLDYDLNKKSETNLCGFLSSSVGNFFEWHDKMKREEGRFEMTRMPIMTNQPRTTDSSESYCSGEVHDDLTEELDGFPHDHVDDDNMMERQTNNNLMRELDDARRKLIFLENEIQERQRCEMKRSLHSPHRRCCSSSINNFPAIYRDEPRRSVSRHVIYDDYDNFLHQKYHPPHECHIMTNNVRLVRQDECDVSSPEQDGDMNLIKHCGHIDWRDHTGMRNTRCSQEMVRRVRQQNPNLRTNNVMQRPKSAEGIFQNRSPPSLSSNTSSSISHNSAIISGGQYHQQRRHPYHLRKRNKHRYDGNNRDRTMMSNMQSRSSCPIQSQQYSPLREYETML